MANDHFDDLRQSFFNQQNNNTYSGTAGNDYFSQFDTVTSAPGTIPEVTDAPAHSSGFSSDFMQLYEQELQRLERERQREERRYRRRELFNSVFHIRWGGIFRFILILIIICSVISIWNMRFAICDSLFELFMGLMPTIFGIWIIWYIIKSFLK